MSVSLADLFAGIMPFVATVEGRTLTRAARLLGVTPSMVSRSIAKLESALGIRLLNRTPRTVSLTPEGSIFYGQCQSAVAGVRHALEAVSHALESPRGVLRVSLPLALGELVVMPALPRLLSRHAGLSMEVTLTDRFVDLISENFDAVVRIGEPRSSGLKRRQLPPVRWSTVASPEDLARHNCLHFVLPNGTPQAWRFGGARRGAEERFPTQGNLASDHPGGLLQATLAGLGLIQAHRYIVGAALTDGRLVEVLKEFVPPPLPAAVLFPDGRQRSPNIRVFVAAMG